MTINDDSEKTRIRAMNVFEDDWHTGMLKHMTDDQIIKCHQVLYGEITKAVRDLREITTIADVGVHALISKLIEETEKRLNAKNSD